MRPILIAGYILWLGLGAMGQDLTSMGFVMRGAPLPNEATLEAAREEMEAQAARVEHESFFSIEPADPARVWDGKKEAANDPGWVKFWGKVDKSGADGLVIAGGFGVVSNEFSGRFFLTGYPKEMAEGDSFDFKASWWARGVGNVSLDGGVMRHLDYGKVWVPAPPHVLTADERKALEAARLAARAKAAAAAVAFNQAAADRGDAYGLLRMGERYRDGDGVARDPRKAREYLAKAAAAGNSQAAAALQSLAGR